ncbi:MAG TPA: exodeoxyribonuclease VII large subunit [Acidimicrobiales bacterium]|nr:exodeoxyribonuclease VII large subunit [Acidimicrobiales bacterium]
MTLFPAADAPPRKLSLVKLSGEIARSIAGVGRVSVEGEVYRPNKRPSGGVYFTLRDRVAQISVWCPPAKAARCRAVNGERVLVTGLLRYQNERGQLQFEADEVNPVGAGAVAAAIADARRRLAEAGLLDRVRRQIPRLPDVIGVVCGSEAAVRADIESVVAERFPGYPIEFAEVPVSGPGAADAVIGALRAFDDRDDVHVIVLARGGGDATQLLTFSDEQLCLAIGASATPVVSAIGHEGDRPLCDEVADLRCGTPSIAAAAVVPSLVELERALAELLRQADVAVEQGYARAAARLEAIAPGRALDAGLGVADARLRQATARLKLVNPVRLLPAASARLGATHRQMEALSPARVLERGYAVVRTTDGRVVRAPDDVAIADVLAVQLAGGRIGVRVEDVAQ